MTTAQAAPTSPPAMLSRAASSYFSSPVIIASPSHTLLNDQAPNGKVTMAGCGLWPNNSAVFSTVAEIGFMGLRLLTEGIGRRGGFEIPGFQIRDSRLRR